MNDEIYIYDATTGKPLTEAEYAEAMAAELPWEDDGYGNLRQVEYRFDSFRTISPDGETCCAGDLPLQGEWDCAVCPPIVRQSNQNLESALARFGIVYDLTAEQVANWFAGRCVGLESEADALRTAHPSWAPFAESPFGGISLAGDAETVRDDEGYRLATPDEGWPDNWYLWADLNDLVEDEIVFRIAATGTLYVFRVTAPGTFTGTRVPNCHVYLAAAAAALAAMDKGLKVPRGWEAGLARNIAWQISEGTATAVAIAATTATAVAELAKPAVYAQVSS